MGWFSKDSNEDRGDAYEPRHKGLHALKSGKMTPAELGKHRKPGDLNGITDDDVHGWSARSGGKK